MRLRRIIFTVLVVSIGCVVMLPLATISGCIGAADGWVDLPPLRVEGKLIRPEGQPVVGETLALGLSAKFFGHEAYGAIRNNRTLDSKSNAWIGRVKTAKDGTFRYDFPERSYVHPVALLFWYPLGGDEARDLRLVIIPADGQGDAYWVMVHDSKAVIQMVEEGVEVPPGTSATALRSETEDRIELTIVALATPQKPPA